MMKMKNPLAVIMAVGLLVPMLSGNSAASAEENEEPGWVKTIKLKGDLRLRYQLTTNNEAGKEIADRSRGRVRARIGIGAKVADGVKVGIGVASGGDDPRSTTNLLMMVFHPKAFSSTMPMLRCVWQIL